MIPGSKKYWNEAVQLHIILRINILYNSPHFPKHELYIPDCRYGPTFSEGMQKVSASRKLRRGISDTRAEFGVWLTQRSRFRHATVTKVGHWLVHRNCLQRCGSYVTYDLMAGLREAHFLFREVEYRKTRPIFCYTRNYIF